MRAKLKTVTCLPFGFFLIGLLIIIQPGKACCNAHFSPRELPALIVSYEYSCVRYNTSQLADNKNASSPIVLLDNNTKKAFTDLCGLLAFSREAYILQTEIAGNIVQSMPTESGSYDGVLFIIAPTKTYKKAIGIVSGISPHQITIFSVDSNLNVDLIYDSFKKNLLSDYKTSMGYIYKVESISVNKVRLYEKTNYRIWPKDREFIMEFNDQGFKLTIEHD